MLPAAVAKFIKINLTKPTKRKETTVDNNQSRPNFLLPVITLLLIAMSIFFMLNFQNSKGRQPPAEPTTSQTEPLSNDAPANLFSMERVGYDSNFELYRDPVTDVLYLRLSGYNETGLITMQDPETGLPLTYSHYVELYNNLKSENP